jgi:hypothetical protein
MTDLLTIKISDARQDGYMVQAIDHTTGDTHGCWAKDKGTAADTAEQWVQLWGYGDDE